MNDTVSFAQLDADQNLAQKLAAAFTESYAEGEIAVSLVDIGRGRWRVAIHFRSSPNRAAVRALAALAAGPAAAKALTFGQVRAGDWVGESLAGLSPVWAGRFVVHGAHDRSRVPANRIGIEIEAAVAFGTGHHGTTRGCLLALDGLLKAMNRRRRKVLDPHPEVRAKRASKDAGRSAPGIALRGSSLRAEHLRVRDRRVRILDLGTGSGVLAIAAARALHRRVLATDLDISAVQVARANARNNRVGGLVRVANANGVACLRAPEAFDLVLANVLLGPLLRLAAPLKTLIAPGGRIVLSGLTTPQANAAFAAYRPLALVRRIDLDGWTTLVLKRQTAVARRGDGP